MKRLSDFIESVVKARVQKPLGEDRLVGRFSRKKSSSEKSRKGCINLTRTVIETRISQMIVLRMTTRTEAWTGMTIRLIAALPRTKIIRKKVQVTVGQGPRDVEYTFRASPGSDSRSSDARISVSANYAALTLYTPRTCRVACTDIRTRDTSARESRWERFATSFIE